ncbi:MAG: 6-phosphofructokinase [Salinivirgaceae bacterium]|nr:MAG: 6-phosphofructokinase [Salinivirgaceae bacterium]
MQKSIAIICGGGPAPGINNVVSTTARVFLKNGYKVLGVHEGFKGLLSDNPDVEDIDFEFADQIWSKGGSALKMSRFKPKDSEFKTNFFQENNIQLLVSIGGDDTASSAARLADFLHTQDIEVKSIHVPKTIDNDLPLPEGVPTFGYQTAKETGVVLGSTVYEDARTSQNWFVMCAMGREAGHLAFGIASACHFPMIIIPEIFNKTKITVDKIVKLVISSIVKRRLMGIRYGVAMISEGVFHFLTKEDLEATGIQFEYDEHGHPELNQVSKAHIFNQLVMRKMKELKLDQKSRPVELGYAMRCARPIGFDLNYTSLLGRGVYSLFKQGYTKCMVTQSPEEEIIPLFLDDIRNTDGRIKTRLVDIDTHKVKSVYDMLHYLTKEDVEAAKEFLSNPEEFVFEEILNWE